MLISNQELFLPRTALIMSDVAVLAATMNTTLLDLAKQANALGTGLQNAAPGVKSGTPNHSVQYLLAIAELLNRVAKECDEIAATS